MKSKHENKGSKKWSYRVFSLFLTIAVIGFCIMPMNVEASSTPNLNHTKYTLNKGESVILKLNNNNKKVTWSSSSKAVATVNSNGKVTAKKKGTSTITAKANNKKYKCNVKVETPTINLSSVTIEPGKTATLKINGTTQKVTWTSSKKTIAAVSDMGVVTAVKLGETTVTAKVGKKKIKCEITVAFPYSPAYDAGQYKVGVDIPAGEYMVFNKFDKSNKYAYVEVTSDANGTGIIANDNFNGNHSIVIANTGDYLKMLRCYAVPIDKTVDFAVGKTTLPAGVYKVGVHIPAGTYNLKPTALPLTGWYNISDYPPDGASKFGHIIKNGNFSTNKLVTVANGQYLLIARCTMTE